MEALANNIERIVQEYTGQVRYTVPELLQAPTPSTASIHEITNAAARLAALPEYARLHADQRAKICKALQKDDTAKPVMSVPELGLARHLRQLVPEVASGASPM